MKTLCFRLFALLLFSFASSGAFAHDYKLVRTYDANGNVVKTATYDTYVYVNLIDYEFLGNRSFTAAFGIYNVYGESFVPTAAMTYSYHGTNNGWYIFVCTTGYHSEYLYVRTDMSKVRSTFMAGGNGKYNEYVKCTLPKRDELGPTYGNAGGSYNSNAVMENTYSTREWHVCSSCGGSGKCKYCYGTGRDEYGVNGKCGVCRGTGRCVGCEGKGGYYI